MVGAGGLPHTWEATCLREVHPGSVCESSADILAFIGLSEVNRLLGNLHCLFDPVAHLS